MIHDLRQGPGGDPISNGYYAIDPSGHLILIPPLQKLKAGFRLATQDDIDAKSGRVVAPTPVAVPVEPEPVIESVDHGPWGGLHE